MSDSAKMLAQVAKSNMSIASVSPPVPSHSSRAQTYRTSELAWPQSNITALTGNPSFTQNHILYEPIYMKFPD